MKLRIRGNSLRLRLTQSEVTTLKEEGQFSQSLQFPLHPPLEYGIRIEEENRPNATFSEQKIWVTIPQESANEWINTDLVGIEYFLELAQDQQLRLLIEKDFACLKPRPDEDESDNYPHPNPESC